MTDFVCHVPKLNTRQDLDQAVYHYKVTDLQGADLFCLWQSIRDAALELSSQEEGGDRVSDESSY